MLTFMKKDGTIILPHLNHVLKSFYFSTEISVFVIDTEGNIILSEGKNTLEKTIYNLNLENVNIYIKENLKEKDIKEKDTLLYTHLTKLTYIIAPFFYNKIYKGSFVAGPILLNPITDKDIEEILQYENLQINCKPKLIKIINETPLKLPPRNFFLGQLLHHLMRNGIDIGMQHIEEKNMQNTFIGKSFNTKDLMKIPCSYNIAIIKHLSSRVLLGNTNEAITIYRKSFNIHNFEYIENFNPLRIIKYNLVSLCMYLIRKMVTNIGILENDIIEIKNKNIINIDMQNDMKGLFLSGEFMIKDISTFINNYSLKDKSTVIQNAINYIKNNYKNPISLEDVAEHVHLSNSYFCTLFKTEMNMCFKKYLNFVRIEHSKSMLLSDNRSILDIALTVGFDNQNYFSTVFKKFTKMTPKEYIFNNTQS